MKKLLPFILAFFLSPVFAGDIALNFKDVPINKLTDAVIKGFLNQDFVITPDAATIDSKVSLSVKDLDRDGVKFQLDQVLSSVGLQLTERRNVLYVEKRRHEIETNQTTAKTESPQPFPALEQFRSARSDFSGDEVFLYFPKYRSVPYLTELCASIVPAAQLKTSVQAVNQTNQTQFGLPPATDKDAIVIKASAKEIEQLKNMLAQVDRPVPEMLVKAVLVEVQTGDTEGSAINLLGKR